MIATAIYVLDLIINLILMVTMVWAILSWLIAFDVVNLRNRFVATVWNTLNGVMGPLLGWIPKRLRYLGGVDISPIVLWLVLLTIRFMVHQIYNNGVLS